MKLPQIYDAANYAPEELMPFPVVGGPFDGQMLLLPMDSSEFEDERPVFLRISENRYAKYQLPAEETNCSYEFVCEVDNTERAGEETRLEFRIPKKGKTDVAK